VPLVRSQSAASSMSLMMAAMSSSPAARQRANGQPGIAPYSATYRSRCASRGNPTRAGRGINKSSASIGAFRHSCHRHAVPSLSGVGAASHQAETSAGALRTARRPRRSRGRATCNYSSDLWVVVLIAIVRRRPTVALSHGASLLGNRIITKVPS
jgi:hypothetical protein